MKQNQRFKQMGSKEEVRQKKGTKCVVPLEQKGCREVSTFSKSLNPPKAYHGAGTMPSPFYAPNVACFPNMYPWIWRNQYQIMQPCGPMLQHPAQYPYSRGCTHPDLRQDMRFSLPGKEKKLPQKKDLDISTCKETSRSKEASAVQRNNVNRALDLDIATNCKENSSNGNGEALAVRRNNVDSALESAVKGSQGSLDNRLGANKGSSATKRQGFNKMNTQDITSQDLVDNKAKASLNLGMKPRAFGAQAKLAEDQQEPKKERTKRLNREAAERSKLRKQQEREKLQQQWKMLRAESSRLHSELTSVSEECGKLQAENKSIMEELMQTYGPEAVSDLAETEGDGRNKGDTYEQIPSCPNNSNNDR